MDEERGKFLFSGLQFLYENELVEEPQLINNLKLNIYNSSSCIKEVEILTSYYHKSILVWIDLNWLGRTFLTNQIVSAITDRLQQLLPRFKFRVVTNKKILEMALARVKDSFSNS